ncbi:MAG: T9SS type A sorting domain-containing protein, partial [Chlorobi bacterium]|nr:T9SS type A sorting domain-containing protein [Chlorobiota bacterium]
SLTDNTGKAELWANIFNEENKDQKLQIKVVYDGESFIYKKSTKFHDGINFIRINAKCNVPKIADIAFVVDATGSMGDEISYLKLELEDVLNKIKKQHSNIAVNTASVFYRDKSDDYLTKKSEFSSDIKTTINFIRKQFPGGGGDFPEAVEEGLNTAINDLKWDNDALAKVIFLILDAPPHSDKESIKKTQKLTQKASEKGIRIVPVTASGINKSTEYLMRSIALATNGTYVFLTDDSGIGNSHIKPTTDEFQVELLNDVFIRLINQYLTIPECNEDVIFNEKEIKDTLFITDNNEKIDTAKTDIDTIKQEIGKVKYYPNPTFDILNIEIVGNIEEMFLADVSGKILQRFNVKNQNRFQINLNKFPAGIYFIQYKNNEIWKTGKIIKRKT